MSFEPEATQNNMDEYMTKIDYDLLHKWAKTKHNHTVDIYFWTYYMPGKSFTDKDKPASGLGYG